MSPMSFRLRSCPVANSLRVILEGSGTAFRPGEEVRGRAEWSLDAPPAEVAVRLCWFTRGKGTEDHEVVAQEDFDNPVQRGQHEFHFRAPDQPYSFSGQLISLIWAVELVIEPDGQCERVELTIGPDGVEIELPSLASNETAGVLPASRVI